jgi:hypothetical protein
MMELPPRRLYGSKLRAARRTKHPFNETLYDETFW